MTRLSLAELAALDTLYERRELREGPQLVQRLIARHLVERCHGRLRLTIEGRRALLPEFTANWQRPHSIEHDLRMGTCSEVPWGEGDAGGEAAAARAR